MIARYKLINPDSLFIFSTFTLADEQLQWILDSGQLSLEYCFGDCGFICMVTLIHSRSPLLRL